MVRLRHDYDSSLSNRAIDDIDTRNWGMHGTLTRLSYFNPQLWVQHHRGDAFAEKFSTLVEVQAVPAVAPARPRTVVQAVPAVATARPVAFDALD